MSPDATPTEECPKCMSRGGCPYCLGGDPDCQICAGRNVCPECLRVPAPASPSYPNEAAPDSLDSEPAIKPDTENGAG